MRNEIAFDRRSLLLSSGSPIALAAAGAALARAQEHSPAALGGEKKPNIDARNSSFLARAYVAGVKSVTTTFHQR